MQTPFFYVAELTALALMAAAWRGVKAWRAGPAVSEAAAREAAEYKSRSPCASAARAVQSCARVG